MEKARFLMCNKIKLFNSKIEHSYYFQSAKSERKYKAIEVDGIRYRLNLESGEYKNYLKSEIKDTNNRSINHSYSLLRELLEMNDFDWFLTLTFDNEKIDRTDDEAVYKVYMKFVNNLKHTYPCLRYITVPERHSDMCLHFHLLVAGLTPDEMGFVDSGKVCCSWATKKHGICSKEYYEKTKGNRELTCTDGSPIFNLTKFSYGFSTASRIASRERCNWYVQKYLDKAFGSTELWRKRFFYSSNLKRCTEVVKKSNSEEYCSTIELIENTKEIFFSDEQFYNKTYNFTKLIMNRENFDFYNQTGVVSDFEIDDDIDNINDNEEK